MEFQLLQMRYHMPYPWDLFDNGTIDKFQS